MQALGRQILVEFYDCDKDILKDEQAIRTCLLYTSDAADDLLCVDLGGRRIIKKKTKKKSKKIYKKARHI